MVRIRIIAGILSLLIKKQREKDGQIEIKRYIHSQMDNERQSEKAHSHFSQIYNQQDHHHHHQHHIDSDSRRQRQASLGQPNDNDVIQDIRQIKLNMVEQQSMAHSRSNNRIMFEDLNPHLLRRNFNSAKERLNRHQSYSQGAATPESYLIDSMNLNKNIADAAMLIASDEGQRVQRERIQKAVKKTSKDVFGNTMPADKPIHVAKYVLGKNQRQKNPAKARIVPTDLPPKAKNNKSGTAATTAVKKSSKSPEQQRNPMHQLQSKTVVAPVKMNKQSGMKKSPSQPKHIQSVASILTKARAQAQTKQDSRRRHASTSLPNIRFNNNADNAASPDSALNDLEGVVTPTKPKNHHLTQQVMGTKGVKTAGNSAHKKSKENSPSPYRKNSQENAMNQNEQQQQQQVLDREFIQRHIVVQGKRHMEKILDKFFPSEQQQQQQQQQQHQQLEEKSLQRLLDSNYTNINVLEAVLNTDPTSHDNNETLNPWNITAEGSAEGDHESSKEYTAGRQDNPLLQKVPRHFQTSVQTTPKVSKTAKRLAAIFKHNNTGSSKNVSINELVQNIHPQQQQTGSGDPPQVEITVTKQLGKEKPPFGHRPAFRLKESHTSTDLSNNFEKQNQRFRTPQNIRSSLRSTNMPVGRNAGTNVMKQFGFMQTGTEIDTKQNDDKILTDEPLQAFFTEQTPDGGQPLAMPYNNSSIIQAKKLAYILNQAQLQKMGNAPDAATQVALSQQPRKKMSKSVSVPVMRKDLKQTAAAMYSQPSGVLTEIAPKEFLQKVDSELRLESLKRMQHIKDAHKESFEQLQQCGIAQTTTPQSNQAEQQQQRLPSRLNTQFSQNVRSMNFFSIFVNNSVDGQIDVEKIAAQTSGSKAISNTNRDDKEMALMYNTGSSFNQSLNQQEAAIKMIQQERSNFASQVNDRKDGKLPETQTQAQGQPCKCNSLSNEMIQALVLDSPIKDLVEAVHTYQFFHQNHTPGKSVDPGYEKSNTHFKDPLKRALQSQIATAGGSYTINERTDVAVLNILLNQILTGKYTFDKNQIFQAAPGGASAGGEREPATGKPDWSQTLDRFLKGINFKGMLSEIQQKILKTQEGVLEVYEESESDDEEEEEKDFFFLNSIKQKELALAELLETRKLPDKNKKFIPGEASTFLTQVYKDSELTQKELEEKFPNWAKARNIQKVSQDIINSHAASKENVAHQKRLRDKKLQKEKEVKQLFDQIHNLAEQAQKTAIGFFQDQTHLTQAEQTDNAGKEQLIYLCFLEIVRQVSGQCKEQAIFLVKLWHSYFDQFQHQMKRTLHKIGSQTNKISELLETMTNKFSKVLLIDEQKDLEFLALIDKHDKALQLLELVSKSLYQEREHTNRLQLELDTLEDNFKDILPNYEKYYQNKEFRQRLMKYSILEQTDAWSQSERQQLHMTPAIRKLMEEQMERDQKQAPIIKDIYRIQSVCTMKMPVDYALENAKEAFQKSAVALKMKEVYYKNLQERAQRLKRQNEGYIKSISDQQERHEVQMIQKEFEAKERIQHAVKMFRQQQLKNILSEPKEVQTDQELIERYFSDLENQKELGVRAMMVSRKLTSVQMQQLRVMKAFEKTPKFRHLQKPILKIMRDVREDQSKLPAKTLKKTLEIVSEIIQERLNLINAPTDNFKIDLLNLEHFYSKFMHTKYGIDNLAQKYTEQWLVSIKAHAHRDPRINLFMRFLGLGGYHSLPFSVFRYYLHLLKATNVDVEEVFANADPASITLSYQKVMKGFRSLIEKTNIFNRRNIMTQLRHNSKIVANNPVILRDLSFSMFETYRYLVERVLKSQKYRSFSELLNVLYENHSYYHENLEAKRGALKKKRFRRGRSQISTLNRGSTFDENFTNRGSAKGDDDDEKNDDDSKNFLGQQSTPKKERTNTSGNLDVVKETDDKEDKDMKDLFDDTDAKKNQQNTTGEKKEGDVDFTFKIRAVDQAEEEKDYIRLSSMVKFIAKELGMNRQTDYQRLKDLFEVILVKAQYANMERIGRFQALRCFTEKIEIAIPMDVFFHIGINAEIDHENSENMWLEKVFNFYSQLMPDKYNASLGMDPDHRLVFSGEHAYDGLEFVQFYIFVKDGGSKMGRDKIKIYQIYEDQLQQKSRQRLSCDDFIELIRKFNLIKTKVAFENNMRMRYEQAKNREVHLETQEKGTQLSRYDPAIHQPIASANNAQATTSMSRNQLTDETGKKLEAQIAKFNTTENKNNVSVGGPQIQDQSILQNSEDTNLINTNHNTPTVSFNLQLMQPSSPRIQTQTRNVADSFEEQFDKSNTPFKTKSQTTLTNIASMSPMNNLPQSRLSVLSKRKTDSEEAKVKQNQQQAQQFVLVPTQDGSLVMTPQPHLGPTMLDMARQTFSDANGLEQVKEVTMQEASGKSDLQWPDPKTTQALQLKASPDQIVEDNGGANLSQQSWAKQTQTTFARPPSPIQHSPDQSRIVDKEVADTIARINFIQSQKAPIYKTPKHNQGGIQVGGGGGFTPAGVTAAKSVAGALDHEQQDEDKDSNEYLIESAIGQINWQEDQNALQVPMQDIVLSRADTFQAHAIEKIDLLSYKLKTDETIPVVEKEEEEEENNNVNNNKEKQSQEESARAKMKREDDQGIGFLTLMFGSDQMKLQDLNQEAKQYVEAEQARIINKVQGSNFANAPRITEIVNSKHDVLKLNDDQKSQNDKPKNSESSRSGTQLLKIDHTDQSDQVTEEVEESSAQQSTHRATDNVQIEIEVDNEDTLNLDEFHNQSGINMMKSNTRKKIQKSLSVHQHFEGLSTGLGADTKLARNKSEFKTFGHVSQIALAEAQSPLKQHKRKTFTNGYTEGDMISEWGGRRSEKSIANITIVPDKETTVHHHVEETTNQAITDGAASKYQEVESKRAKSTRRSRMNNNNNHEESRTTTMRKIKKVVKKKKKKAKQTATQTQANNTTSVIQKQETNTGANDDIEGVMEPGRQKYLDDKLSSLSADDIEERKDRDTAGLQFDSGSSYHINIKVQGQLSHHQEPSLASKKQAPPSRHKSQPQASPGKQKHNKSSTSKIRSAVRASPSEAVPPIIVQVSQNQEVAEEEEEKYNVDQEVEAFLEQDIHLMKSNADEDNGGNSPPDWDKGGDQPVDPLAAPQNFNFGNAMPPAPPLTKAQIRQEKKKKLEAIIQKQREEEQQKKWEEGKRNALFAKRTYQDEDDWIFGNGDEANPDDDDDQAAGAYLP